MNDLFPVTPEDALAELKREQNLRANVYPKWVGKGRMSQNEATVRQARLSKAIEILEEHLR